MQACIARLPRTDLLVSGTTETRGIDPTRLGAPSFEGAGRWGRMPQGGPKCSSRSQGVNRRVAAFFSGGLAGEPRRPIEAQDALVGAETRVRRKAVPTRPLARVLSQPIAAFAFCRRRGRNSEP